MPCMCSYDAPEESKRLIKQRCQELVDEVRRLQKDGDPLGISIESVKELIDHLAYPERCKEKDG